MGWVTGKEVICIAGDQYRLSSTKMRVVCIWWVKSVRLGTVYTAPPQVRGPVMRRELNNCLML